VAGPTRFLILVSAALIAGGVLGWFAIRRDLLGLSVGVLILCAPLTLLAVIVGVLQVRREGQGDSSRPHD